MQALREFFQHERDQELGRWRSAIDPGWTAVENGRYVQFRHDDGKRAFSLERNAPDFSGWSPALREIGHEWFAAHPEPKPWHDAKPGEVWVLTTDTEGEDHAWMVDPDYGGGRFVFIGGLSNVPLDHPDISAGRRIWPEVSDVA